MAEKQKLGLWLGLRLINMNFTDRVRVTGLWMQNN